MVYKNIMEYLERDADPMVRLPENQVAVQCEKLLQASRNLLSLGSSCKRG